MDAVDPCATCGAPMASDQRYCLECGARRAHTAAGLLGGGSQTLASGSGSSATSQEQTDRTGPAEPTAGGALAVAGGAAGASTARSGGPVAVIAGVGVLLLAMGVGVLIGRSGSGNGKPSAIPAQVISVASPGTGATSTSTTSTPALTTPSTTKSSGSTSSGSTSSKSKSSSEIGQTPSKPAPPSVLPKAGGSGQSYEQKSKNLPNVVSTG